MPAMSIAKVLTPILLLTLIPFFGCASRPTSAPVNASATPGITSFKAPYATTGSIEVLDDGMNSLIDANAKIEVLAEGFGWGEGPTWIADGRYLVFSDVPGNTIYKWKDGEGISVFMRPSGGLPLKDGKPDGDGSNGLFYDSEGHLLIAQHGARRIVRLDNLAAPNGGVTVLADQFGGKRFHSPNDLVPAGTGVFFTDPPYGLKDDSQRELPSNGVYYVSANGDVRLVDGDLERPNGIALSPDGATLYVANSDSGNPIWKAYTLDGEQNASDPRTFFDAQHLRKTGRSGGNDGMRVDEGGNIVATGPGGVLFFSPDGRHLGSLLIDRSVANCAFGDDGKILYLTAKDKLLRVKLKTRGLGRF